MESDLKLIPRSVLDMIYHNRTRRDKVSDSNSVIKVRDNTRNALMVLKQMNGVNSLTDVVDMLISMVALTQYNDDKNFEKMMEETKFELSKGGVSRSVTVGNREFYSVASCAKFYKITPTTVRNRIENLHNYKYKIWNYTDEDKDVKYASNRIE